MLGRAPAHERGTSYPVSLSSPPFPFNEEGFRNFCGDQLRVVDHFGHDEVHADAGERKRLD